MFLTDPGLVPLAIVSDGETITVPDLFWLDGPLIWDSPEARITIPFGFVSDDASVPKFLDWVPFLDRQGLSRRAGLCHDGLYSLGRSKGKAWADMMLEQFCLAEGMNQFQAACYYKGVSWFGASSWAGDASKGIFGVTIGDFVTPEAFEAWNKNPTVFR